MSPRQHCFDHRNAVGIPAPIREAFRALGRVAILHHAPQGSPTALDRGIVTRQPPRHADPDGLRQGRITASVYSPRLLWRSTSLGESRMTQQEQSRHTRNLSILLEVSNALASQVRLDELLATIISKTAGVLDAERATLFL